MSKGSEIHVHIKCCKGIRQRCQTLGGLTLTCYNRALPSDKVLGIERLGDDLLGSALRSNYRLQRWSGAWGLHPLPLSTDLFVVNSLLLSKFSSSLLFLSFVLPVFSLLCSLQLACSCSCSCFFCSRCCLIASASSFVHTRRPQRSWS